MPGKEPKPLSERIIAAAREHSGKRGGVRSPLYDLLWDQHDALAPHLNPPRTPNWQRVAQTVAADGVLDGRGQLPKAATVQKTWAKVVRDKARLAGGPMLRSRRRVQTSTTKEARLNALPPEVEEPKQSAPSQASALNLPTVTPDDEDEIAITPFTIRSRKPGEGEG